MRVSRRWAACHAALKTKRQHRRVDWLNWALPTPVTPKLREASYGSIAIDLR